ncbi:MAG TPA: CHAT domain-containing tetratricopeptide repeat protein [Gemmatimonadaceae bacterium]|jgi:CHAT domain-containing protein/tetratricopeptide (TPR) repeat protein
MVPRRPTWFLFVPAIAWIARANHVAGAQSASLTRQRRLAGVELIESTVAARMPDEYVVVLRAQDHFGVQVYTRSGSVAVEIRDNHGRRLGVRANRGDAIETLRASLVAASAETLTVVVRPTFDDVRRSSYRLIVDSIRHADDADVRIAAAERWFYLGRASHGQTADSLRAAVGYYEKASEAWRVAGTPDLRAAALRFAGVAHATLSETAAADSLLTLALGLYSDARDPVGIGDVEAELGELMFRRGSNAAALAHLSRAMAIAMTTGDSIRIACIAKLRGQTLLSMGEPQRALEELDAALHASRSLEQRAAIPAVLDRIGSANRLLRRYDAAFAAYREALSLARETRDRTARMATLNNRAVLLLETGEPDEALDDYGRALALATTLGNQRARAAILANLADIEGRSSPRKALAHYEQSLIVSRALDDRGRVANTLSSAATLDIATRNPRAAVTRLEESRVLLRAMHDSLHEAIVVASLATAHAMLGQQSLSHRLFDESLSLSRSVDDRYGVAITLRMRARAERDDCDLVAARASLDSSLQISESIRRGAAARGIRSSVTALFEPDYEAYIDVLMRLARAWPDSGFVAEAFQAAERARARGLVDAQADARDVSDNAHGLPADTAPIAVADVQRRLLDSGSVLLEYALTDGASYGWVVTRDTIIGYALPGRAAIDSLVREYYGGFSPSMDLRSRASVEAWRAARASARARSAAAGLRLSRMLLAPARSFIANRRIVVSASGSLQYVPFAALPDPSPPTRNPRPVIIGHEVVVLPSASAGVLLDARARATRPASKTIAIVADPVFDPNDDRLPRNLEPTAIERSTDRLHRLSATRAEGEWLAEQVSERETVRAVGFQANLNFMLDSALANYAIVHVATHALLDDRMPQRSAIVLSTFDSAGHRIDGLLSVRRIYDLDLPGRLVVLSACETAVGRDLRGEGVVGLGRAFLYAGARVVGSLWKVDDAATRELMTRFYRELLGATHPSPAAALRSAQVAMWRESQAPANWAGFVYQGDWRRK